LLPQVEEIKNQWVLFTSEGRRGRSEHEIGSLYWTVMVKRELSQIYQSIYVPTLTYGHELWLETERMSKQIQIADVAKISFLCRMSGLTLRDMV